VRKILRKRKNKSSLLIVLKISDCRMKTATMRMKMKMMRSSKTRLMLWTMMMMTWMITLKKMTPKRPPKRGMGNVIIMRVVKEDCFVGLLAQIAKGIGLKKR
jgi:hypothetical protein